MKKRLMLITFLFAITGCSMGPKCPDGYEYSTDKCIKKIEENEAKVEYSCNDEFNLEDEQCVKYVFDTVKNDNLCSAGYTYSNGKCIKYQTINATMNKTCPSSSYKLVSGRCEGTFADTEAVVKNYYCLYGSEASNGKCLVTYPAYANGRCPGQTLPLGNGLCYEYKEKNFYISCARGEQIGSMCYTTVVKDAIVNYTCPAGYVKNGTSCTKTITANIISNDYCSEGFNLVDGKCVKKLYEEPTKTLYCESEEYILEEQKCVKYEYIDIIE